MARAVPRPARGDALSGGRGTPGPSGDVLVVGGGPAGLASALLAARRGRSVVLLEAADRLGGMAASTTVAGQRVDLGSHRLHPSAPPRVRALLDELLGDDLQVRERRGRLHLADRWVGFPLRPADLVRSLPPRVASRIAWELTVGGGSSGDDGAGRPPSYADVVRDRLGPTVLERFHGPYATKLWGVAPSRLAGSLARRRIALDGAGAVVRRLLRASRSEGRVFLYPRRGYGQVVEALADAAVEAGVEIRTGTQPRTVLARDAGARVTTDDGTEHDAGRVLWTAPPTALADAVGVARPALDHRGVALVYLVHEGGRWLPWDAHYVPDLDVPFVRLSEPRNYRDGPDPADRSVLCAEVPCTAGDATWRRSDADLAAEVVAGIDRLGLPAPAVAGHDVIRLPRVYPSLAPEDEAPLASQLATLERLPSVTLLGRQGLAVTDNLHHVLAMAAAAADCLAADGWDQRRWERSRRAFDDHVVED